MQVDRHQRICHIIDRCLAGAASLQEEQTLREHVLTCAQCKKYLDASQRVIAGLGGFSFEVNPDLHGRVIAAIGLRAKQLESQRIKHIPLWWTYSAALMLTPPARDYRPAATRHLGGISVRLSASPS